jgi:uncharacterized phage protein gp47/JayE
MPEFPFVLPDFLKGQSADEVHNRMFAELPDDIDKSELQFAWDLTRPTALVVSETVEYRLVELLKQMFPQWAYGDALKNHAYLAVVTPKEANKATGVLTIKGTAGTVIPKDKQFATTAIDGSPSIFFETLNDATIGENGTVNVPIIAVVGGKNGNVPKDTIILQAKTLTGITSVTNNAPTTGGTEAESDDALRKRILDKRAAGLSFVGNDADYVRWAMEVSGVGAVIPQSEWNGPGTMRLIIVDENGLPANQQILDAVYDHIMSPDNNLERLAPIGKPMLTVIAPTGVSVDVSASVILKAEENILTVTERFKVALDKYWLEAINDGREVKFSMVGSTLADTPGISDYEYESLRVNDNRLNLQFTLDQFPVTGEVTLNDEAGI